jgi:hypothetical protein
MIRVGRWLGDMVAAMAIPRRVQVLRSVYRGVMCVKSPPSEASTCQELTSSSVISVMEEGVTLA